MMPRQRKAMRQNLGPVIVKPSQMMLPGSMQSSISMFFPSIYLFNGPRYSGCLMCYIASLNPSSVWNVTYAPIIVVKSFLPFSLIKQLSIILFCSFIIFSSLPVLIYEPLSFRSSINFEFSNTNWMSATSNYTAFSCSIERSLSL